MLVMKLFTEHYHQPIKALGIICNDLPYSNTAFKRYNKSILVDVAETLRAKEAINRTILFYISFAIIALVRVLSVQLDLLI